VALRQLSKSDRNGNERRADSRPIHHINLEPRLRRV
jgi:hypothetical protein